MNRLTKWICLTVFALTALAGRAQEGRHAERLFGDYGKREGSVLIELAKDVLGGHTRISRYKSLIAPLNDVVLRETEQAVCEDLKDGGAPMMESRKDGKIEKACYHLGKRPDSGLHEYILLSAKSGKMTLIYLKGSFPPDRLEEEIGKLKNLFIKVNGKHIKL